MTLLITSLIVLVLVILIIRTRKLNSGPYIYRDDGPDCYVVKKFKNRIVIFECIIKSFDDEYVWIDKIGLNKSIKFSCKLTNKLDDKLIVNLDDDIKYIYKNYTLELIYTENSNLSDKKYIGYITGNLDNDGESICIQVSRETYNYFRNKLINQDKEWIKLNLYTKECVFYQKNSIGFVVYRLEELI